MSHKLKKCKLYKEITSVPSSVYKHIKNILLPCWYMLYALYDCLCVHVVSLSARVPCHACVYLSPAHIQLDHSLSVVYNGQDALTNGVADLTRDLEKQIK